MNTPTLDNWLTAGANRHSLHRVDRIVACAPIERGDSGIRPLTPGEDDHRTWDHEWLPLGDGTEYTLEQFLTTTHTDAFMVIQGESVLYERYFASNTQTSRHIVMSVSKSVCGMLAGILIDEGSLRAAAQVTAYLPELEHGSYTGATVRDLLDMTARPHFDMNYVNADAQVQTGDRCAGWRPRRPGDPSGTREFLAELRGHDEHGRAFQYCSASTDVLSWVIERAAGRPYRELLRDRVWRHIGAEDDALITVDPQGIPYACAGISMRLRDLARFGRLVLDGGARSGKQVIPYDWIQQTRSGGRFDTERTDEASGTYTNQWWIPDDPDGAIYAAGIFGQYLWLDPVSDVVIAKFSSERLPLDHTVEHVSALSHLSSKMIPSLIGSTS